MNNLVTLVGVEGDIFWDLPAWVTYVAGSELGCTIYVANTTDEVKEYCLMAKLLSGEELILEESIPVHGYTWFVVDPNDFLRLHGAFAFDITNVILVIELIEREADTIINTVSTYLVAPTIAQWPPGWPGAPTLPFDWSQLLMLIMFVAMGVMMVQSLTEKEKEKKKEISYEERVALPI